MFSSIAAPKIAQELGADVRILLASLVKRGTLLFAAILLLAVEARSAADGLVEPVQLRLLTLNAWQFWPLSKDNESRWEMLCSELGTTMWDVVFLQEVWDDDLKEGLSRCGPYHVSKDSEGFAVKPRGLVTLTRIKPIRTQYREFQQDGHWRKIHDGEKFASKGVLLTQVEIPNIGEVVLANAHTIAQYPGSHTYARERSDQIDSALDNLFRIKDAGGKSLPAIFGGDLNTSPPSSTYEKPGHKTYNSFDTSYVRLLARLKGWWKTELNEPTYSPDNPYVTGWNEGILDHLFVSPEFCGLSETRRICDFSPDSEASFGAQPSDHCAVSTVATYHPEECPAP